MAGVSRHLNVEVKARCLSPEAVLARLRELGAVEQGVDHQVDTYFRARSGRLKLRTGNIENYLIHYERPDSAGPKPSVVTLHRTRPADASALGEVLTSALGELVVVDKQRHILWIGDVKFHVDRVQGLGSFVEIEVLDRTGNSGRNGCRRSATGTSGCSASPSRTWRAALTRTCSACRRRLGPGTGRWNRVPGGPAHYGRSFRR